MCLLRILLFFLILVGVGFSMARADTQQVVVQLRFCNDTPQGTFCDALTYTQAEFAASTPAQRNAAMNARTQAWRQSIINGPPRPTWSVLQLQKILDDLDDNVSRVHVRRQRILDLIAAGGGQE